MTIKLTYEHICDGCKALLDTEEYICSNNPNITFPLPHRRHSFWWAQLNADLCRDCAEPMYKAQEETMQKIKESRQA